MRNNPQRSIESSTDHASLRYIFSFFMSHQGTLADALVIQAVADALNLTLHIIESNPGFALVTNMAMRTVLVYSRQSLPNFRFLLKYFLLWTKYEQNNHSHRFPVN